MITFGEELTMVYGSGWGRWGRDAVRAVALGSVALSFMAVAGSAAAEGGEGGGCPLVASAQGVQVMVAAEDNLLTEEATGAGVPVAQACVNYGLSDSRGFASNPYPGATVVALPALVWGPAGDATGQPTPGFPGYAASSYPAESESRADQPGYSLSSKSTETSSRARAQAGLAQDAARAGTTVAAAESVVDPAALAGMAKAESDTQPLTFDDVLELGRVRSAASAAVDANGAVKRSSSLSIGRTTVAGQVVQITPRGVEAAGQTVPAPGADPAEALEAAGVKVRYLAEEKTARGVLSAGVEVVVEQESPTAPGKYNRVRYVIGRSYAAAEKVDRPQGGGPEVPPASSGNGTPVGDVTGRGDSGAPVSGPVPSDGAAPPASAPEAAESPPAPEAAPQLAAPRSLAGPIDMGMTGFYLVLVCAAVAMFAGMTLLRLLGVRTRWTS